VFKLKLRILESQYDREWGNTKWVDYASRKY
jgi:hypothetical protein